MVNKKIITQNFSKSSVSYDYHSCIQLESARKLMSLIGDERSFSKILEVGCGTGTYTMFLHEKFPQASITGIDISENMVKTARGKNTSGNVNFLVQDAESVNYSDKYDLITSNASFQWFEDIESTFKKFSGSLTPGGVFCFSMYGPRTFFELRDTLKECFENFSGLSSNSFPDKEKIERVIKMAFKEYIIEEQEFQAEFESLWDLLRDIKYSGTRGEGMAESVFWTKTIIRTLEKLYVEKFGKVVATHHIYFCKAVI